jgi:hypothetical protein
MTSAVTAASSATGRSEVPAHTTSTVPVPAAMSPRRATIARASWRYSAAGTTARTASYDSCEARVTSRLCPRDAMRSAMAAICAGVLPIPRITSGKP